MVLVKEQLLTQKLEAIVQRYEQVGQLLSDRTVVANFQEVQRLGKERAELMPMVKAYQEHRQLLKAMAEAQVILETSKNEPGLGELAERELRELKNQQSVLEERIKGLLVPRDLRDEKNTLLEIRAGTGGGEAALFAAELFRMYTKYAERRGWRVELVSSSPTGIGGFKEVIAIIEGKGTYSRFKYESGVHRVQRVPATEAGGRIHTSTVTVAVLPEAEEVDIQIDLKDLRIDTFCSSGPGGQGVNTTHSAVRILHQPSGLIVSCQDERSQIKNRAKGMRILRSRLLEMEQQKQNDEIAKARRSQVGTGDRSEKIRTYNFSQNRITDHRAGLSLHKLEAVLEGELDELIEALTAWDHAERLQKSLS
ncbi:MAG TPA: peptide chain release factor 1 [Nitrospiria bacterium]|jgi:peptide chain release factor 1|nr:peptide chain release factor 1 [Nitrospiria bacterium]